jgi:protocatechuate 3,4-dioxygenase beta subunit
MMPRRRVRTSLTVLLLAMPTLACAQSGPDDPACQPPQPRAGTVLTSHARIAPPAEPGERMRVSLRFVDARGVPHTGLMVYAYHTNAQGHYPVGRDDTGCFRWHGALHAYTRTDSDGRVSLETIRPGPYPGRTDPQHVHVVVQFPGAKGFYLNALVFSDDPRVTAAYRASERDAGNSGVATPQRDSSGTWVVQHTFQFARSGR